MSNEPSRPRFASLTTATEAMDVTDEPVIATTQLLFVDREPAAAVAAAPVVVPRAAVAAPARREDGLPEDPVALLEELLVRIERNRRR